MIMFVDEFTTSRTWLKRRTGGKSIGPAANLFKMPFRIVLVGMLAILFTRHLVI